MNEKRGTAQSTGSEAQVRALIHSQLHSHEVLLEGIRFTDPRHGDVEADFLVLIPDLGIAVIEVKGGDVTLHNGQWRARYANVKRRIDPIDQARRAKHALRRYLDRQPEWTLGLVRSEWFVVLPYTTITNDMSTEARRDLLIGREDLADLLPNIRQTLGSTLMKDPHPDVEAMELALSLLLRNKDLRRNGDLNHNEEDRAQSLSDTPRPVWKRPVAWFGAVAGIALLVSGAILFATNTSQSGPQFANSTGDCDPNYEPCIPLEEDLSCPDIKMAVTVIGTDIHGFDRDGDLIGCETYQ